eukprot:g1696.t1
MIRLMSRNGIAHRGVMVSRFLNERGRFAAPRFSTGLENIIDDLSTKPQTSVSLKSMVETGIGKFVPPGAPSTQILIQVASFLHRELPIRFAHRVKELDNLPLGLARMPSIQKLRKWYCDSLEEVISESIPDGEKEEEEFKRKMKKIYARHADTLITIAKGLYEFKNSDEMHVALEAIKRQRQQQMHAGGRYKEKTGFGADTASVMKRAKSGIGDTLGDFTDMHKGIDEFLMHRIGIRVIIGQYLAIDPGPTSRLMQFRHLLGSDKRRTKHSMKETDVEGHEISNVGLISTRTMPADIARAAAEDATDIFERQITDFDAPEVDIIGNTSCSMAYIPSHLYYILFELLKNSMRATAEHHRDSDPEDLPPIKIVIGNSGDLDDVVIKISDLGGGIPQSHSKRIFNYLFTTAAPAFQSQLLEEMESFGKSSPLAGLGYGLPIARLYARYFGGDLRIMSVEGYGTDAYLTINRMGDNREPLSY